MHGNRPISKQNSDEAIGFFETAVALDPQAIDAAAWLAVALTVRVTDELSDFPDLDLHRAEQLADKALAVAPEFQPDVALLDIGLPVMNGYELAGRMRRHERLAHVRLIALTGYGQETDRARSVAAGFDEHLVKPVNPHELARVLAR